jgi:hypothetical protein
MAQTRHTQLSPPNLTHTGRLLRLQNLPILFLANGRVALHLTFQPIGSVYRDLTSLQEVLLV